MQCSAVQWVAMPRPGPPSSAPAAAKRRRPQTAGRLAGSSVSSQRSFPAFTTAPLDQQEEEEEEEEEEDEERERGEEKAQPDETDDRLSDPFPELAEGSALEDDEEDEDEDEEDEEESGSAGEQSDESSGSAGSSDGEARRAAAGRSRGQLSLSSAPPSFEAESSRGAAGSMRLLSVPSARATSLAVESDSSGDEG